MNAWKLRFLIVSFPTVVILTVTLVVGLSGHDPAEPVEGISTSTACPHERIVEDGWQPSAYGGARELYGMYESVWTLIASSYYDIDALNVWASWRHCFDGRLQTRRDLDNALFEMMGSLNDRWTRYVSAEQKAQQDSEEASGVVPLGLYLQARNNGFIDYVERGSAAWEASLRRGDELVSIDGRSLQDMTEDDIRQSLKARVGASVTLIVRWDGVEHEIVLTARDVDEPEVEVRLLEGNILYLRLSTFTEERMISSLWQQVGRIHESSIPSAIVLDLRGNGGGRLDLAVAFSNMVLPQGTIVSYTERNQRLLIHQTLQVVRTDSIFPVDDEARAVLQLLYHAPMVVLVDGSTASAAEMVTAALQENGRATVFGTRTYGKGVGFIESSLGWMLEGEMSVTTLIYTTPAGNSVNGTGLEPDVIVEQSRLENFDAQLDAALEWLRSQS